MKVAPNTLTVSQQEQILFALNRQIASLEYHADSLMSKRDYSAEFPAEDAERLDEAKQLIEVMVTV